MIARLRARLAARARAWARRRAGSDSLPLAIHRRRVYILPTRFGVIYVFALVGDAARLDELQQQPRLRAHLPAREPRARGDVSLPPQSHRHPHRCHRERRGVRGWTRCACASVARTRAPCPATRSASKWTMLSCWCRGFPRPTASSSRSSCPPHRRGLLRTERCVLSTRFPLGLFRAWTLGAHANRGGRVPEARRPPAAAADVCRPIAAAATRDARAMRTFVAFASTRRATRRDGWPGRRSPRGGPLLVKDLAGAMHAPRLFSLDSVQARGLEEKLSQIAQLDPGRGGRRAILRSHPAGNEDRTGGRQPIIAGAVSRHWRCWKAVPRRAARANEHARQPAATARAAGVDGKRGQRRGCPAHRATAFVDRGELSHCSSSGARCWACAAQACPRARCAMPP